MRTRVLHVAWVLLFTAYAAACTTTPPPSAALQFASANCSSTPDMAGIVSLTPPKEQVVHVVDSAMTPMSNCLVRAGTQAPYVIYALPDDMDDKTIIVGGVLEASRIFAPLIEILDASGQVLKTFQPEDYYYRGPVYSVQFRPQFGQRYLLVTADTTLVGQSYDSIQVGVNTSYVSTGLYTSAINTGVESRSSRTFSYEGVVRVMLNDTDIKEGT